MAHFLYPLLKKRGSASIVNFASVRAHEPEQRPRLRHLEGAIHALTGAMAVDCARDGIASLGLTRLDHVADAGVFRALAHAGGRGLETLAGFGRAHSAGRVGTIEEVAALVSYLVGPESGFFASAATFPSTADWGRSSAYDGRGSTDVTGENPGYTAPQRAARVDLPRSWPTRSETDRRWQARTGDKLPTERELCDAQGKPRGGARSHLPPPARRTRRLAPGQGRVRRFA